MFWKEFRPEITNDQVRKNTKSRDEFPTYLVIFQCSSPEKTVGRLELKDPKHDKENVNTKLTAAAIASLKTNNEIMMKL